MISFLKQFSFFRGLTQNALVKISYHFQLREFRQAGKIVCTEGQPADWIVVVKDGECEVCKQDLKGVDQRIVSFLQKKDEKKEMTKIASFKPESVFGSTCKLFPF